MLAGRLTVASLGSTLRARLGWPGFLLAWESPLWSALVAGLAYFAIACIHGFPPGLSQSPFYNYLADAFLHGQLYLRLIPENVIDLVRYQGHYYLYWPPLPAVLLAPFVSIFGVGFSDAGLTVALGVMNVCLVALLIRRADITLDIGLTPQQRAYLVLFFALGTVHFALVGRGRVWETGQLTGFALVAAAYLCVLSFGGRKAFFLTGLFLGAAALTRNHLILAGLWPAWYLLNRYWRAGWRRLAAHCLYGLLPIACAGALFAAYNWARFGNALDVGLSNHLMDPVFREEFGRYGAFNLHYLPTNLYYQLVHIPLFGNSLMGGSLFLMSPLWFAIFWAGRDSKLRASAAVLGLGVLVADLPVLLLMGTGWRQFGSRYTLDFTVALLLLAALGIRYWRLPVVRWLTIVSIGFFAGGAITLARILQ